MFVEPNNKDLPPPKKAKRLVKIGLVILVATPCTFCGLFVLAQVASQGMAYALLPPEYPNGQLESQWRSGGTVTMWDRRTYLTPDSLEDVLAHYESHLPEFTESKARAGGVGYFGGRCDRGWLARQVAWFINKGKYEYTFDDVPVPCLSVWIYQAPDNSSETQYEVWLDWPAS